MEKYDIPNAMKPILEFVDDASNWYVRRSRKRFWKSDNDSDKNDAYKTLHYVLVQLSMILAPFTPFLSEELYQKLTGGESVHLLNWPKAGKVDEGLLKDMLKTRQYINLGLAQRAKAGIKVRQPLSKATIYGSAKDSDEELAIELITIICEELNVKTVDPSHNLDFDSSQNSELKDWPLSDIHVELDLEITDELMAEGMMREVIRHVQNFRKNSGLEVDDRISLSLSTESDQLKKAIDTHKDEIMAETLAEKLTSDELEHTTTKKIEGDEITISLQKV